MRVIGGELKRRTLRAPSGNGTRPSSDRLRQALFNVLGEAVRGWPFIDAYAGSGAVGIEAWSRGARPVVWIERAPQAARTLRANLAALGLAGHQDAVVWERDVVAALAAAGRRPERTAGGGCFFFDPPYADSREYQRVFAALDRSRRLIRPGTAIIAESRRGAALPPSCGRLHLERIYRHGDSQLAFYAVADVDADFVPAVKGITGTPAPAAPGGGCNLPGRGVSK